MKRHLQRKRVDRVRLDAFASRLWAEWRRLRLPQSNEAIVVAVSGGADSSALLLGIHDLTHSGKLETPVFVAHLDHELRDTSKKDALMVSQLAGSLGFQAIRGRADVRKLAQETGDNLEQAARQARYAFLERAAKRKKAGYVLVAHTMDDQAETVLLRLLRGSSSEGLSGMDSVRLILKGSTIRLARPLLSWARRTDTETFCRQRGIEFIIDEMNQDQSFARVKVRQQLLPLMQSLNNRIVETLLRTANLLKEDSASLAMDAARLLSLATERPEGKRQSDHTVLKVSVLAAAPSAVRRRALRQWLSDGRGDLKRVEHVHLLGVERLLEGERGGRVAELPDGTKVRRKQGRLELIVKRG
jgi:tRNA(Ile)-lysidine synthase